MERWLERITPDSRKAFALGLAITMAVLGITILCGAMYVRTVVRSQIANRDAEALHATTMMELLNARSAEENLLDDEALGFQAAVLASRLKGVVGIRFFDRTGKFKDAFPANIQPKDLNISERKAVEENRPAARFTPQMALNEVFIYLPQFATGQVSTVSMVEIVVPLGDQPSNQRIGAAQFIVEGQSIALEYARLDRHLALMAGLAMVGSGLLLLGMLWPIFWKMEKLNAEIRRHHEKLVRANEELALAARTSALGAVSAHLMHGLKNPLANLSEYLKARLTAGAASANDDESRDALSAARRMQRLVEETMEVISDMRSGISYQITIGELLETVTQSVSGKAARSEIRLVADVGTSRSTLSSRTANLVRLILVNLADNAIEATPKGKTVTIEVCEENSILRMAVKDEGSGFPSHLRKTLFLPCASTREKGGGVGLAISHRIAEHLGGSLSLARDSAEGCTFVLEIPLNTAASEVSSHSEASMKF